MSSYLFILNQLKKINIWFLLCILILQSMGLVALYSTTYGASGENLFLFKQQITWIALSWLVFFAFSSLQIQWVSKVLWPLFWLNMLFLVLVFFFGKEAYNAKRWLDLGLFHYQPSETLKFILILLAAKYLSQRPMGKALKWEDLLKLCVFILPPVILILIQPDLGTAGIILLMILTVLLFNGIEKKLFISLFFASLVSMPMIWNFVLKPYQKARVVSFLKPEKDPQGTGYNVIQSKIAIGSGQILGKGFKKGTQNKLQFLPERHTDFIFSVLSEEHGFIGSGFILLLFFLMISFIFNLASTAGSRLKCYFCMGAGVFLLWHTVPNLAMTMGFFPVVGIPLPLLSYGGSHTITTMAFLGLTASIHRTKDLF